MKMKRINAHIPTSLDYVKGKKRKVMKVLEGCRYGLETGIK